MLYEPYSCLPLERVIALESSLEHLHRETWNHKIDFEVLKEGEGACLIPDHDRKRIVVLDRLRGRSIGSLGIARQIVCNWLLGQTRGKSLPQGLEKSLRGATMGQKEIQLFLQGSEDEIRRFQNSSGCEPGEPSIDWKLYAYPIDLVGGGTLSSSQTDMIKKKYPAYSVCLAYGVVSRDHHVRTDKKILHDLIASFFGQHGFTSTRTNCSFDMERTGEPIVLWQSGRTYKATDYPALVGINFGFDNGFSGFRLGLGVVLEDDIPFCQVGKRFLQGTDGFGGFQSAFDSWIHHTAHGSVTNRLQMFLDTQFEPVFDAVCGILDSSKKKVFSQEAGSRNFLEHTHTTDFANYQEPLRDVYSKYSPIHGHTRYSHFLCWNYLSKKVLSDELRLSSTAEWIAACIIRPS